MRPKSIITGVNGFVGTHLCDLLVSKNHQVFKADLDTIDLNNYKEVDKMIYVVKPDYIFHLAASAFVPSSFHSPQQVLTNNIIPAVNIFEAVRKYGLSTRILIASSSEQYGKVKPEETPITERNEFRPQSPYAISKITMEMLGKWYADTYGLNIIITRGFNHSGRGRGEQYVTSTFAKQIVEIENGREPIIKVGNLESKRDFTDVRDMVEAYTLAVDKCIPGEPYNICSGETISIKDMLNKLLKLSKAKNIKIEVDEARLRPSDVPILLGDNTKFVKQTGWKRKYNIDDMLLSLLEYWREKLKK